MASLTSLIHDILLKVFYPVRLHMSACTVLSIQQTGTELTFISCCSVAKKYIKSPTVSGCVQRIRGSATAAPPIMEDRLLPFLFPLIQVLAGESTLFETPTRLGEKCLVPRI